eukprot:TRINITY_DN2576_c0_g1_i11.p1 TRINITY_DN2576_c0_g1~~TRINITY_DN2576_c0_g1_i11.p1  ORF type:complete len:880 (-),score=218.08 TRINITY_DN2576_c0_g1_i11:100-2631(-)
MELELQDPPQNLKLFPSFDDATKWLAKDPAGQALDVGDAVSSLRATTSKNPLLLLTPAPLPSFPDPREWYSILERRRPDRLNGQKLPWCVNIGAMEAIWDLLLKNKLEKLVKPTYIVSAMPPGSGKTSLMHLLPLSLRNADMVSRLKQRWADTHLTSPVDQLLSPDMVVLHVDFMNSTFSSAPSLAEFVCGELLRAAVVTFPSCGIDQLKPSTDLMAIVQMLLCAIPLGSPLLLLLDEVKYATTHNSHAAALFEKLPNNNDTRNLVKQLGEEAVLDFHRHYQLRNMLRPLLTLPHVHLVVVGAGQGAWLVGQKLVTDSHPSPIFTHHIALPPLTAADIQCMIEHPPVQQALFLDGETNSEARAAFAQLLLLRVHGVARLVELAILAAMKQRVDFGHLYRQQQQQLARTPNLHRRVFDEMFSEDSAIFKAAQRGANGGAKPVTIIQSNSDLARAYMLLFWHVQTRTPFELGQKLPNLGEITLEHLAACGYFTIQELSEQSAVLSVPPVLAKTVWSSLPRGLVLAKPIEKGGAGLEAVGFLAAASFSLRTLMSQNERLPLSELCSALNSIVPNGRTKALGQKLVSLVSAPVETKPVTLEGVLEATVGRIMSDKHEFDEIAKAPSNCLWKGDRVRGGRVKCADLYLAANIEGGEEVLIAVQFKHFTTDNSIDQLKLETLNAEVVKAFPKELCEARPKATIRVLLLVAPFLSGGWQQRAGTVLTEFPVRSLRGGDGGMKENVTEREEKEEEKEKEVEEKEKEKKKEKKELRAKPDRSRPVSKRENVTVKPKEGEEKEEKSESEKIKIKETERPENYRCTHAIILSHEQFLDFFKVREIEFGIMFQQR